MKAENWYPGYQLTKGHPFDVPASKVFYKNRPIFFINEAGKAQLAGTVEDGVFTPDSTSPTRGWPSFEHPDHERDFLYNRNYQAHEALYLAESQINDMLEEFPFIPETYGFELAHKHEFGEAPARIYVSKLDSTWSLYRKPNDDSPSQSTWRLLRKREHGEFDQIEVNLPCARIAYAAFWALGIKMKADVEEISDIPAVAPENMYLEGSNHTHTVRFKRGSDDIQAYVNVTATSNEEAFTKAKFHLETDPDDPIENVLFEELSLYPDIPAQG